MLLRKDFWSVILSIFRGLNLEGPHLKSTHLHKQWNGIESSDYNPVVNIPSKDVKSSSTAFHYLLHADTLLEGERQLTSWYSLPLVPEL